jgi:two-component system, cell cycle sensor histidine kinase and response regulator CckA
MKARILVVEDESIVQLDLQMRLRRLGHSVVGFASRGEEAVAKAVDLAPDLVLMDVRLEGAMNGVEAARRIRAERQIPIIFVTAFADSPEMESEPLRPRLSKPFATPELQAAIAGALGIEPEGS